MSVVHGATVVKSQVAGNFLVSIVWKGPGAKRRIRSMQNACNCWCIFVALWDGLGSTTPAMPGP